MNPSRRSRASTPPNLFTRITRFYATANKWIPSLRYARAKLRRE